MTRARNWFLVAAIAAVGLACGSDGGASGTGGSGGHAGASGKGGSGGTGLAGSHGGAGTSGGAGTNGGAGAGGGSGGSAGTGGEAGSAGGAGTGGHAGSGGAGGAGGLGSVCGGITGATCSGVGEFCNFGNGQCGANDQQGHCELGGGGLCPPQVVCGCDGQTYSSACDAHANGFDIMSTTACIPGNGGTGAPCGQDTDCMSGYKCCVTGGRAGSPIACKQVAAGASCPALP